ncbi:iron chaperone [Pelolinea submarina]|uniref:Uncharacterized protein YdhG (YjbR/CyaY superfamily) n=1 Tax=Pelolinea submarina TaxID=913107 RepID=A0A347ZPF4_9CHLR|nr:DUF1801 domain-containing protein [Pelolinea submarina]REG04801.1 uncharacterized protein YdhG (YjbR/CyaY superfamily) [Pelolinea submarina]BBB47185.1 hypothetical protein Pelsub_P0412 [Pelolinea submarina]
MDSSKKSPQTIDEYMTGFPAQAQAIMQRMRDLIHEIAPEATEKISYGIPTFVLGQNLVHFAAYQNHIGFYPSSSGIAHFEEELRDYETSKGTVRFPLDKPIPYDLVRRITEFRVAENRVRAKAKKSK